MRLTNKIVESVVCGTAGPDVVPLVLKMKNKKNLSEFKLAESLNQEVNITRNMLYRLLKYNLVSFTRKKDKVKGWYIYYWTFRIKQVKYAIKKLYQDKLEKFQERLQREESEHFFKCAKNECLRVSFEKASDFKFKCPECGELLEQEDNSETIKKLKKDIKELQKTLKTK